MNKIKTYLKFLMCIVLINALVLPTYATSGHTSGDAFITKEDFDVALSDFNRRLSIFEAGINSKIDSQVSSYLDRNGIWSATKVEEFDGQKLYVTKVKADQAKCYDATRNGKTQYTKVFEQWEMKAPKAGLFSMVFTMYTTIAAGASISQLTYTGGSVGREATWYIFGDLIDSKNNGLYSTVIANSRSVPTTDYGDQYIRITFRQYSDVFNCFVKKGETYKFRIGDYWNYNNNATLEMTDRIPYPWYFDVKSANVY